MYYFLKEHFSQNRFYYFIILLTKLRIVLYSLVLPHYYGRLISTLKSKNIDKIKYIFFYLIFFGLLHSYVVIYMDI